MRSAVVITAICSCAVVMLALLFGTPAIGAPVSAQETNNIDVMVNDSSNGQASETVEITIEQSNSSVNTSSPGDVSGNDDVATDPDGDGVYEDVNGDGEITYGDLQALYAAGIADGADRINAENESFFDFNGQDGLTYSDLQALFSQELRE